MKQSVRGISTGFPVLSPSQRQITHVLLSRLPLDTTASGGISFDLHALGVPPTFVLSQDQTLRKFTVLLLTVQLLRNVLKKIRINMSRYYVIFY